MLPHFLPLLFFISILRLAPCSSSPSTPGNSQRFRSDPYEVLRVDPKCAQKEIQRCYRDLCLEHHPDKKRNGDYRKTVGTEAGEGEDGGSGDDFEFKEVQHAYSLVGTEEDRRNYDLRSNFNLQSSANNHDTFSRYAANNRFGNRADNNMFGPSTSTIHFTFEDGVLKFSRGRHDMSQRRRDYASYRNPFVGANSYRRHHRFGEMSQDSNRPRYIQKISIPLQVLYSGGESVELELKTSIFERYKAAFNGGVMKPALMQAAMTVLVNWLRSQKVNWFLSFFLFASMVHMHIPSVPEKVIYSTNIRRGWKGGTKIKYKSADADVEFVLQESGHDTFTRVGNDLHARVEVSAKQLKKGCTLTLDPLRECEKPIKLKLKRKEAEDGQIFTVKSRGWPIGGTGKEFGDLQIKICCDARDRRDDADRFKRNTKSAINWLILRISTFVPQTPVQ